jgi:hypothetical protein
MNHLALFLRRLRDEEDGHVIAGIPALIGAFGALALACGAAEDISWVAYMGGVLLAVGVLGGSLARHRGIDYEIYDRLETLEKPRT